MLAKPKITHNDPFSKNKVYFGSVSSLQRDNTFEISELVHSKSV